MTTDTPQTRRFPPPWRVVEVSDEGLAVVDANGMRLCYLYFEENEGRRHSMQRLTPDEARRIASGIARLPELLGAGSTRKD